jgi:hypothetical protein
MNDGVDDAPRRSTFAGAKDRAPDPGTGRTVTPSRHAQPNGARVVSTFSLAVAATSRGHLGSWLPVHVTSERTADHAH